MTEESNQPTYITVTKETAKSVISDILTGAPQKVINSVYIMWKRAKTDNKIYPEGVKRMASVLGAYSRWYTRG